MVDNREGKMTNDERVIARGVRFMREKAHGARLRRMRKLAGGHAPHYINWDTEDIDWDYKRPHSPEYQGLLDRMETRDAMNAAVLKCTQNNAKFLVEMVKREQPAAPTPTAYNQATYYRYILIRLRSEGKIPFIIKKPFA